MKKIVYMMLLVLILLVSACSKESASQAEEQAVASADEVSAETSEENDAEIVELTVMTHDSFYISDDVIADFENKYGVKITFVRSGDTGAALNKAILTKDAPIADVFYGIDNTFLTRALDADIFEVYASPKLNEVPDEFELDDQYHVVPIDYGDVCINYDKAWFSENGLAVPLTLEDLTKPEYAGLLAVENPATSSPGLAFLMATIAHFGEEGYLDYWTSLKDNGLVVVNDWETAYYTNFSGSSGMGPQPMVVSYGTSPAAEVIYAEEPLDEAPTASIVGQDACYRQIEFAGILKGAANRQIAELFVDYMLDISFQEDIPAQMFVFPVNQNAAIDPVFLDNVQIPEQPASLDPVLVSENREVWIESWTDTVLD